MLSAGGLPLPEAPEDAQPSAIPNKEGLADDGHRT